jgi:hypothetical protein
VQLPFARRYGGSDEEEQHEEVRLSENPPHRRLLKIKFI